MYKVNTGERLLIFHHMYIHSIVKIKLKGQFECRVKYKFS